MPLKSACLQRNPKKKTIDSPKEKRLNLIQKKEVLQTMESETDHIIKIYTEHGTIADPNYTKAIHNPDYLVGMPPGSPAGTPPPPPINVGYELNPSSTTSLENFIITRLGQQTVVGGTTLLDYYRYYYKIFFFGDYIREPRFDDTGNPEYDSGNIQKPSGLEGYVNPEREKFVFLFKDNSESAPAHELLHALGLQHPFEEIDKNESNKKTTEENIDICEKNIIIHEKNIKARKDYRNKYKNYQNQDQINITNRGRVTVKTIRDECDKAIEEQTQLLEKAKIDLQKYKQRLEDYKATAPQYTFEQATTDNIMDYNAKKGERIRTNSNEPICFYKHQWDLMNDTLKSLPK
jgi:hypothetical protein